MKVSLVIAALFAVVLMAGWPLLLSVLSVETLVAGSFNLYWFVAAAATMGFGGSWFLFINTVAPVERRRRLHNPPQSPLRQFDADYAVQGALILGPAAVSLWLLFVLRHSADPVEQWNLSRRSWLLFWEVLAIDLISLVLLLSTWSTPTRWAAELDNLDMDRLDGGLDDLFVIMQAGEGAKGLRRSMARCGLLWLPASAWVAVAFVVDHSFVEQWFTIAIGGMMWPPVWSQILVACGIAVTILGVAYELQVYHQEHRAVPVLDDQGCARRFAWLCFTLVLAGATFFATVYLLATL